MSTTSPPSRLLLFHVLLSLLILYRTLSLAVAGSSCEMEVDDIVEKTFHSAVILDGILTERAVLRNGVYTAVVAVENSYKISGLQGARVSISEQASGNNCLNRFAKLGNRYFFFLNSTESPTRFRVVSKPVIFDKRVRKEVKLVVCDNWPRCIKSPSVSVNYVNVTAPLERRVTLRCRVNSNPPARVFWYKDGTLLQSRRGLQIKTRNSKYRKSSTLTIRNASSDDSGRYVCRATSLSGQSSKEIHVRVSKDEPYPIQNDGTATDTHILPSYNITILNHSELFVEAEPDSKLNLSINFCSSQPFPSVRWFKMAESGAESGPYIALTDHVTIIKDTSTASNRWPAILCSKSAMIPHVSILHLHTSDHNGRYLFSTGVPSSSSSSSSSSNGNNVSVTVFPVSEAFGRRPSGVYSLCDSQSYCLNGGTCMYMERHNNSFFCRCPDKWTGARCDLKDPYLILQTTIDEIKSAERSRVLTVTAIVIVVVVLLLMCILAWYLARVKRHEFNKRRNVRRKHRLRENGDVNQDVRIPTKKEYARHIVSEPAAGKHTYMESSPAALYQQQQSSTRPLLQQQDMNASRASQMQSSLLDTLHKKTRKPGISTSHDLEKSLDVPYGDDHNRLLQSSDTESSSHKVTSPKSDYPASSAASDTTHCLPEAHIQTDIDAYTPITQDYGLLGELKALCDTDATNEDDRDATTSSSSSSSSSSSNDCTSTEDSSEDADCPEQLLQNERVFALQQAAAAAAVRGASSDSAGSNLSAGEQLSWDEYSTQVPSFAAFDSEDVRCNTHGVLPDNIMNNSRTNNGGALTMAHVYRPQSDSVRSQLHAASCPVGGQQSDDSTDAAVPV